MSVVDSVDPAAAETVLPLCKYFVTSIALITSSAVGAGANVMACEWLLNVSYRPLRVMTLINRDDYTHELIDESGEFGVNLCSDDQASLSSFAGNSHGRETAKLDHERFAGRLYQGTRIAVPMLRGCLLNLECLVEQEIKIGDHTAFIGRAVAGRVNREAKPLLYHQGRYFHLGEHLARTGSDVSRPAVDRE